MKGKINPKLIGLIPQVEWAKLAAFIDGEGSILLKPATAFGKYKTLYLAVHIINTDPRLMQWLWRTFGGRIYQRGNNRGGFGTKAIYDWAVFCKDAETLLRGCLPYFVIKRDQAELGLAHQATLGKGDGKVSDEIRVQRQAMSDDLKALKRLEIAPDDELPIKSPAIN